MTLHNCLIRVRTMVAVVLTNMVPLSTNAQVTTEVEWQRCIGGSGTELGVDLIATSDGGFISIGWSTSTDGDAVGSHGGTEMLVTKLNADGTVQWRRPFGGSSEDRGGRCIEASDGSILLSGSTSSTDGDVTSNQGDSDVWILKLSPSGTIIWQRTYGGGLGDLGGDLQETPDGGFVIKAVTNSADGDVVGFHPGGGAQDAWVFKIDVNGDLEWSRALGGSSIDSGGRLLQTADGGYLASFTYTESNDGDVTNYKGEGDCWLVKLSATGAIEWQRTVGGSQRDFGQTVLELSNGDYMLLGTSLSSDGDLTLNQGGYDVLLAKISSTGTLLWQRTYGGSLNDDCRSLLTTPDGGFILAGLSGSSDGDVTSNVGEEDVWILKVDANGTIEWQRSFGGSLSEFGFLFEADQGGYVLSGYTYSSDGTAQGSNGDREVWLLGINTDGDLLWQRCLGGAAEDWGYLKAQTSDGGYVAFGYTDSNDGDVTGNHGGRDMWVVKLRVTGPLEPVEPLSCALFVPNAFSPNNSTSNDEHCIYGTDCVTSMTFNIFDRWGNKVFASTDPKACWDGTYNGQALDPAAFVYHLRATLANAEVVEKKGNIMLVR